MKRLILFVTLFIIIHSNVFSQGCLPEGITFGTQEQIDNFQANYPGCTEIEGWAMIGSYSLETDITNLHGLNGVTLFGDGLDIRHNPLLTNLEGLENLTSIGNDFSIQNTNSINSLSGLENLTTVGGNIFINNANQGLKIKFIKAAAILPNT